MEKKIKVAIVGASGYSGEELVRLLLAHPHVELAAATSRQYAGQTVAQIFRRHDPGAAGKAVSRACAPTDREPEI